MQRTHLWTSAVLIVIAASMMTPVSTFATGAVHGAGTSAAAPPAAEPAPTTAATSVGTASSAPVTTDNPHPILGIDGSGDHACIGSCPQPLQLSLNTVGNDVVVLLVSSFNIGSSGPPTSVSDSFGSTYSLRTTATWETAGSNALVQYEYWAEVPSTAHGADTISVFFGGMAAYYINQSAAAISVSDVDLSNPWDPAVPTTGVPANWGGTPSSSAYSTVTTVNPNDLVFGLVTTYPGASPLTPTSGFTSVVTANGFGTSSIVAQSVTTTGAYTPGTSLSAPDEWGTIADALQAGPGPCCGVAASPVVGYKPAGEAYDPSTNQVFVSNWAAGSPSTVSVISTSSTPPYPVSHTVSLGGSVGYPNGEAYDAATHTIWVTNWGSTAGTVSEICDGAAVCGGSPAAYLVVATLTVGSGPYAIAYDPADNVMLVAETGYGPQVETVVVVNAATIPGAVLQTVTVGPTGSPTSDGPRAVTYDPTSDAFYVSNPFTDAVDVVARSAGVWVWANTVPLPPNSEPYGLVVDSGTNQVFVADSGTNSVSIINAATQLLVGSVPLPAGSDPAGVAYDAPCGEVLVTEFGSATVTVIDDTNDVIVATVYVGDGPIAIIIDSGAVFRNYVGAAAVSNYGQNATSNQHGNVSFIFCTYCNQTVPCNYTITFNETGLPVGTTWSVTLDGVTMSATVSTNSYGTLNGTSITFSGLCPGTYSYTVPAVSGYSAVSPSGTVTIPVGLSPGSEVYETIGFTSTCSYTITFNETGLPPGTTWSVTVNGVTVTSSTSTLTFYGLCPGSYTYVVNAPSGYVASPSSGTLTISTSLPAGSEVYQAVVFTAACTYTITFNETGLPPGTSWSVTVNGVTVTSPSTTLTFYGLCAGSYTFVVNGPAGYTVTPSSGTLTIASSLASGSEVYQPLVFSTPCNYTVTLNETGLPVGSTWSVTLNGVTMTATVTTASGSSITFSGLCPGSYSFRISGPRGYTANPTSGTATIPVGLPSGSEVYERVSFQNLEFTETGLPAGTPWDVTVVGHGSTETVNSTGPLISLSVAKGTYKYTISKPCEYKAHPLQGSVTVRNAVVSVGVTFSLLTKVVDFKETGLRAGTSWSVTVTGPKPVAPFMIVTTTYTSTSPRIAITTVCGNYSWNASTVVVGHTTYFPGPAAGTFSIQVTGNTIRKVPAVNPIVIRYAP